MQVELGERLRERRLEQGHSLRSTAMAAAISVGHLSEIENGRSSPSLAVLLRLCRSLDYPLSELLPRINTRRVRRSSLYEADVTEAVLSHNGLGLVVRRLTLTSDDSVLIAHERDSDMFAYVYSGDCQCEVDGVLYDLGVGDSIDIEHCGTVVFRGVGIVVTVSSDHGSG